MSLFNRQIRLLLVLNTLVLTAVEMIGPIYALFVEEIGGGVLEAGFTAAFFALSGAATTVLTGKYLDRKKDKKLILAIGYALLGVGSLMFLLVNNIYLLFAVQVILGFAEAISLPAFDALFSHYIASRKEGMEWGSLEAGEYIAEFLGGVVGGIVAYLFGFKGVFILMGGICLMCSVYVYRLPRWILE